MRVDAFNIKIKMCEKRKKVEELLKKNPRGLTIQDISNESKLARNTVKIILVELKGEDKIEVREVGKAKLHYWRKNESK